jgi:hypothetical protein
MLPKKATQIGRPKQTGHILLLNYLQLMNVLSHLFIYIERGFQRDASPFH